ncbi:MAG: glycosyltransferase [Gammaproteobacteria bacterium]|nr:glycosyltransferase [Gammaproteobacteria bacterium]
MRVSVIAAFYKDIVALKLIIDALRQQDYDDFELVVAEDNNDPKITDFLNSVTGIDIVHTTQDDIGIRKARSQNNAIIASTGEYLIFIDADCIPYRSFISSHAMLAKKGEVLSGRRVNLGPRISSFLRKHFLKSTTIERFFLLFAPILILDGATHMVQGLFFKPDSFIYRNIISKRKKSNTNLLGCNFSCFKEDMLTIDGFDEYYLGESCLSDDTDLEWRFKACGFKLKPCKMSANIFHLYHGLRPHQPIDSEAELSKMMARKKLQNYVSETGISSHKTRSN